MVFVNFITEPKASFGGIPHLVGPASLIYPSIDRTYVGTPVSRWGVRKKRGHTEKCAPIFSMAEGPGFEPGLTESESVVLPLDDPPANRTPETIFKLAPGVKGKLGWACGPGSEFRVPGSGFRVPSSGFRVPGSVFRVPCSGFRVPGFGFRVHGWSFGLLRS